MESSRCEDCGNQAKKECGFRRCRTCCKNKGFICQTHVSSTWIPLHTRRHYRLSPHQQHPKRIRLAIPGPGPGPCSSESKFPVEVNSMAVFRCLRVSSFHGGGDEHAYQTSVSIGGHVFTGILYDQGHVDNYMQPKNASSSLQHHPLPPFSIHSLSTPTLNFPSKS